MAAVDGMGMRGAAAARRGARRWVLGRARAGEAEQGAILVLAAVGFTLALVAAALAVDLGRVAAQARDNQAVADLAALDAVRDTLAAQSRAEASAARNGFTLGADRTVVAEVGTVDADNAFILGGGTDAVRVTVTSPVDHRFAPGSRAVTRVAVATKQAIAGFSIGSSLGTVSTSEAPLLNRLLERFLGGTVGSVSLVSYNGLANAYVNVGELAAAMGFATVSELLTADVTLAQLLAGTATVLNADGVVAAADVNALAAVVTSSTTFQLGDFLSVDQGALGRAAGFGVNALQLVTAAGALANQDTFLDAGAVVSVPGVASTRLGVKVIEAAQTYIGPVGGSVDTSQVDLTLTPAIDTGLGGLLRLSGNLPVSFVAAAAVGTLSAIDCTGPPPGITVGVAGQPVTTRVAATLGVSLLGVPVASVAIGPVSATGLASSNSIDFDYPSEFSPTAPSQATPSAPAGASLGTGNVTVTLLGALPLGVTLSSLTNSIIAALNPIINNVVSTVSTPVLDRALRAAGVSVGPVDTAALAEEFDPATCGEPRLVG